MQLGCEYKSLFVSFKKFGVGKYSETKKNPFTRTVTHDRLLESNGATVRAVAAVDRGGLTTLTRGPVAQRSRTTSLALTLPMHKIGAKHYTVASLTCLTIKIKILGIPHERGLLVKLVISLLFFLANFIQYWASFYYCTYSSHFDRKYMKVGRYEESL